MECISALRRQLQGGRGNAYKLEACGYVRSYDYCPHALSVEFSVEKFLNPGREKTLTVLPLSPNTRRQRPNTARSLTELQSPFRRLSRLTYNRGAVGIHRLNVIRCHVYRTA